MNNYVRALAVIGTDLYAGGDFTTAGGNSSSYFSKYATSSIASGTDSSTEVSALSDSSGNIHLAYTNSSDNLLYKRYNASTSSWSSSATLSSGTVSSPALTINGSLLDALWIESTTIYSKTATIGVSTTTWNTANVALATGLSSPNNLSVNYNSAGDKMIFMWTAGSANPYDVKAGTLTTPDLYVAGNWTNNGGTFTTGTGTVTFNGSTADATQSVNNGSGSFYNVTINNTGTGSAKVALSANALTALGAFTLTSGTFDANAKAVTVTGLTSVNGGAYLASTDTQSFNGGLTVAGGVFTGSSGTVNATNVSITSGTVTAPATMNINGNVTLTAGTYTAGANTNVAGNWTKTGGTFNCGTSSTVTFTATDTDNTIRSGGSAFYNLTFNGSGGEWAALDDITVSNDLTISAGTFNVNALSVANTATIATSTSANATLNSSMRKTFYDTINSKYWAFYYTGSAIQYAYSADGSSWTTVSTLAYNTPYFSLTYKEISSSPYVLLVSEANSYDVVLRRGAVGASSITFADAVTVYDGSSATDKYIHPCVSLDANNYVWVASLYNWTGDYRQAVARRSTNIATGDLSSWQSQSTVTSLYTGLKDLVIMPQTGSNMYLITNGANNSIN